MNFSGSHVHRAGAIRICACFRIIGMRSMQHEARTVGYPFDVALISFCSRDGRDENDDSI